MIDIAGHCPMGCGETLFVGASGHVTCSYIDCPRPDAADVLLHLDTEHAVIVDAHTFTVEHPPRERVEGNMHLCPLHRWLVSLDGPPAAPGRYRARPDGGDGWLLEALPT